MRVHSILVTGASGLLGHAVHQHFDGRVKVTPVAFRNARPGLLAGNLADPAFLAALEGGDWDAVIHCAALRSPDYCATHPDLARQINAELPVTLARMAHRRGARMIHVSTDYVFDGTRPPYRETDPCRPVNLYGETKLAAEQGIAAVNPKALIMRIGALYGVPVPGIGSPMLEEAIELVRRGTPAEVDHRIKRYPLFVEDVAAVAEFLLQAEDVRGIVHVGSPRAVTRYEWSLAVAAQLGLPTGSLTPSSRDLTRSAVRPVDAGLATDRLREWGGPVPPDFRERLPGVIRRICHSADGCEKKLSDPNHA